MRTVSREELYQQVWSRPMTKVATEYGVTGTALKKTCSRHKIPTPERGYWAKLETGKPVRKTSLPKLAGTCFDQIRIAGSAAQNLPEEVRKAKADARVRLEQLAAREPAAANESESGPEEPSILSATRRAISRARTDDRGFASAQGRGIVALKISPGSIERAFRLLTRLFALAETDGYRPKISDTGLVLARDDVSIAFGLEERPQKTLHEPTASELKRRDDHLRWGSTRPAWPKYDYSPSGRLAIVIYANSYSGLRRTYSAGQTQSVEAILPDVIAGLAEHSALVRERQRADQEQARQQREAEARRLREEAFNKLQKRRMEFVDSIHEQLVQRSKLSVVLAHLENFTGDEASFAGEISAWIRRRVQQIDALTSPQFLDISARSAKVDFSEATGENAVEPAPYFNFQPPVTLQFWSIDNEKELATSITALEWAIQAGALSNMQDGDDPRSELSPSGDTGL
ncbi:MAG: hypothetical protein E6G85_19800 [Alphaproteobacteria bacterium]|nr:MAG: hypothetical protein E6G85_19800 [Alphaproteobacteria bacterium]